MQSIEHLHIKKITAISEAIIADVNDVLDDGKVWNLEEGNTFLSDRNTIFFLAYFKDSPAGFLYGYRLQRFDKRKAEVLLYEIAVAGKFQKRGIGSALIDCLKEWAKAAGADEVWVLTNKSNSAAMALYKSAGGTIESTDEQMFTFSLS